MHRFRVLASYWLKVANFNCNWPQRDLKLPNFAFVSDCHYFTSKINFLALIQMNNFTEGDCGKILVKTPSKLLTQLLRYKGSNI